MVTVTASNASSEYAVMKVLHQLVQSPDVTQGGGNATVQVLGAANLSGIQPNEILFIVGHGSRDNGDLGGITTAELLKKLNDKATGVPAHTAEIRILTCFGGEVLKNSTLVERVAKGLNHQGIRVTGAKGFTYGSPVTKASGYNSVLSNDLIEFYEGNDEKKMLSLAKNIIVQEKIPNWEAAYVPNWPPNKTGTKLNTGDKLSKVPEQFLVAWIKEFLRLRAVHQQAFKNEIANLGTGDINAKLNALLQSTTYQQHVNDQYHQHKLLFTPESGAYTEATS